VTIFYCDPLPPFDSRDLYQSAARPVPQAPMTGNALTLFIQSILPNIPLERAGENAAGPAPNGDADQAENQE